MNHYQTNNKDSTNQDKIRTTSVNLTDGKTYEVNINNLEQFLLDNWDNLVDQKEDELTSRH